MIIEIVEMIKGKWSTETLGEEFELDFFCLLLLQLEDLHSPRSHSIGGYLSLYKGQHEKYISTMSYNKGNEIYEGSNNKSI